MGQSLRQIKNRIRSIENTKKVTGAMEMISAAKLNRIDKTLFSLRPYFSRLDLMLNTLLNSPNPGASLLLEERAEKKKVCLCLVTSDSGLCGAYNNNIIRAAEEFIAEQGPERVSLVLIGKKGFNYFRHQARASIINSYVGLNGHYSQNVADEIGAYLIKLFLENKADEVYAVYTSFVSAMRYKPVVKKVLNIEAPAGEQLDYILEPDKHGILEELIPKYIAAKIRLMVLEAFTSEHAARMVAMKTATDNAKDLLRAQILQRNKVRQANITQEMLEIVSSTEALKG